MATINGFEYDHSSHRFRMDGIVIEGVTEASYPHGFDGHTKMQGTGIGPSGETRGVYKADDASFTLTQKAWRQLQDRLGQKYMLKRFAIIVERDEENTGFETDVLENCRIVKSEPASSKGGEGTMRKLTISVRKVIENGKQPY